MNYFEFTEAIDAVTRRLTEHLEHSDIIRKLEECIPDDVKRDIREMSEISVKIHSRMMASKAMSVRDVERFNELCYKRFPAMQDGKEFTKEERRQQETEDNLTKETGICAVSPVQDSMAMDLVYQYVFAHADRHKQFPDFQIYIVWKCKVLQNWKWLLSTTLPDGMYYELTYNGDKHEYYLDAYKKVENNVIPEIQRP